MTATPRWRTGFFTAIFAVAVSSGLPAAAQESVRLPTEMCRGLFLVPLSFGTGADDVLWFVYDTGASRSYVDGESLARVGRRRPAAGRRVLLRDVGVGPVRYRRLPARVADLDHLEVALGREVDGILGFRAFGDLLVTLDYARGEVRLAEGRLPAPDGRTVFNAGGADARPWMQVEVAGRARSLLVDSGAGLSSLVIRGVERLETLAPLRPVGSSMRLREVRMRRAARLAADARLGPHTLVRPIVQDTSGTELLGGDVLRHFTWTFDPARKRLEMLRTMPGTPITSAAVRAPGLVLVPDENGLRVHAVIDGSPGENAGVRAGDVVTGFDGRSLRARGCEVYQESLDLTLLRQGRPRTLTLDLFPLID